MCGLEQIPSGMIDSKHIRSPACEKKKTNKKVALTKLNVFIKKKKISHLMKTNENKISHNDFELFHFPTLKIFSQLMKIVHLLICDL